MENNITRPQIPEVHESQLYYGAVVHWITIISCVIALFAPVLILLFPEASLLNPNRIFGAIFAGKTPAEIWLAGGVDFQSFGYWKLFWQNVFNPDGLASVGIALGCSVTLWGLFPAAWAFLKKKEYFYAGVALFVMALIALAMSGVVNMAG